MKLSHFNTLAEAQAYELTKYRKITVGQAGQYFGLTGMLDALEANSLSATLIDLGTMQTTVGALCRTILNSAKISGFACDPATEDGANNRGAAQLLLAAGVFPSQSIVDGFWSKGEVVTKPFESATQAELDEAKDAGETINIAQNNNQHTLTLSINTQPLKPIQIMVQQRFGSDASDLTEWHDCGQFQNVYYRQRNYQTTIPASPAVYRELRAVSPLTLGVSVA